MVDFKDMLLREIFYWEKDNCKIIGLLSSQPYWTQKHHDKSVFYTYNEEKFKAEEDNTEITQM